MTSIPTTTGDDGTGIPRVSCLTGWRYGTPPVCAGCGQEIVPGDDYLVMWSGTAQHPRISAAAHHGRSTGPGDDYDTTCPDALRRGWELALRTLCLSRLRLGADGGDARYYAGSHPLRAGDRLSVLTDTGVWLAGRFEYTLAPPARSRLYIDLAGFAAEPAALDLDDGIIVQRQPQTR